MFAILLMSFFSACSNPFWPDTEGSNSQSIGSGEDGGGEDGGSEDGNGGNKGGDSGNKGGNKGGGNSGGGSSSGGGGSTSGGGGGNANLSGDITISPHSGVTTGTELNAVYSGSEAVDYLWQKNGTDVGTNSIKYTPTEAGSYTVTVSAPGYNHKTSAAVNVVVEYKILIDILDNRTGDAVTVSPDRGVEGDELTLSYTVAKAAHYNQLDFSGVNAAIASVDEEGTGTRTYKINAADSSDEVITITAVFTHTDLVIDHIAFTDHDKGHITKTYGDAPFTNAVTTAHHGSGTIAYHSSDTSVAVVNSSGQVTILSAGSTVISAEKPADLTYAHAQTTYTLTVNHRSVTITGLSASSKVYDGTAAATVTGTPVIIGLIPGDEAAVTVIAGTASFADSGVGNNKTVTFSGWSLGGDKAANYTLQAQPASVTASILPDGSADAPFLVTNEAELRKVGTGADGWTLSVHYKQTANIAMTGGNFTRIGNSTTKFSGSYDGGGFTITGLSMSTSSASYYLGLFGYIGSGGTVKNMNVTGTVTNNGNESTGGIAGANEGTIDNCSFSGTVNGSSCDSIGGIVGQNEGTVINSRNTASVNGRNNVGGIAGANKGKIDNSYNTGAVNGNAFLGGIAGTNDGNIKNCYNTGDVTSAANYNGAGGIAGYNASIGRVECCYNTGNVTGSNSVAGIVGNSGSQCAVQYCVSLGAKVTGAANVGRVVGYNSGALAGNIARSNMKIGASGAEAAASANIGATATNGASVSLGSSTALSSVFSGFDSTTIWNINTSLNTIAGGSLPTLKTNTQSPAPTLPAEYLLPGNGTAGNPFLVANEADLRKVGTGTDGWTRSVNYRQTANITMTGGNFTPIGTNNGKFSGVYDGDGYTITGLSITATGNYTGLFGYVSGTVKNMNVTGTVTQNGSNTAGTGGIAGENEGTIDNCSFSGTVRGNGTINDQVGGIVGQNNGTVSNSRNSAAVTGNNQVGGIAGTSQGKTETSYNTGAVRGNQQVGGIAGTNVMSGNYIRNCYNTGNVSTTANGTANYNVGGITGLNQQSALVEYCYNTGNISGYTSVGGIAGNNNSGCIVRYCVSLGAKVTGNTINTPSTSAARVVGTNGGTLTGNRARQDMKIGASGSEAVPTANTTETAINGGSNSITTVQSNVFASFSTSIWNINGSMALNGSALPTLKDNMQSPAPTLPAAP